MAKDKTDPAPAPEPTPAPKPEPVNPATGEKETEEWRAKVDRKLDGLAEKAASLGKAIQEWGTGPEPKPTKPPVTSVPPEKAEPLDPWAG